MLLLVSNVHEKGITESQDKRNFDSGHAIVICMNSCYNFAFVLHKKMRSFSANQTPVICSRVLLVYLSRESHCLPELSRDVQWNTSRTNMVRKGEKMSIFNSTTSERVSILSFDNVKQSYLLATGCSIVFSRSDGELSHGINEKFRKKSFKNITPQSHRQPQPLSDLTQNLVIDGDR